MATKKIALNGRYGKGKFALVDEQDFDYLNQFKWYGRLHKGKYLYASRDKSTIRMHRVITGAKKGLVVDHINHDTLDNRRINLRVCTNAENSRNRGAQTNNTSGYKGVYWVEQTKKWRAIIIKNKKRISLGCFSSKDEAAAVYNLAALKYHSEFAYPNLIEGRVGS